MFSTQLTLYEAFTTLAQQVKNWRFLRFYSAMATSTSVQGRRHQSSLQWCCLQFNHTIYSKF